MVRSLGKNVYQERICEPKAAFSSCSTVALSMRVACSISTSVVDAAAPISFSALVTSLPLIVNPTVLASVPYVLHTCAASSSSYWSDRTKQKPVAPPPIFVGM